MGIEKKFTKSEKGRRDKELRLAETMILRREPLGLPAGSSVQPSFRPGGSRNYV